MRTRQGNSMKEYPEWLRRAASKGGKKSRRTLTPEQARAMVNPLWLN